MTIMLLSLFNAFSVPMTLTFEPKSFKTTAYEAVSFIIDFMFFLDILFSFNTVYTDDMG